MVHVIQNSLDILVCRVHHVIERFVETESSVCDGRKRDPKVSFDRLKTHYIFNQPSH